jgi:ribosomal-protein-alanine N-acetyltransferase
VPSLVGPALPPGSLRIMEQPRIPLGDGLVLRPWEPGDVPALRAAFESPDIERWHLRRFDGDDEAREWIAAWPRRWAKETDAAWAIARERDDAVVGYAALRGILLAAATGQVSYWVTPAARGAGVATRAASGVSRWGLRRLGLQRVYLLHSVANAPSCRVAEAAGFRNEGTLRDYMLHADGWHDVHMHAVVRSDVLG